MTRTQEQHLERCRSGGYTRPLPFWKEGGIIMVDFISLIPDQPRIPIHLGCALCEGMVKDKKGQVLTFDDTQEDKKRIVKEAKNLGLIRHGAIHCTSCLSSCKVQELPQNAGEASIWSIDLEFRYL